MSAQKTVRFAAMLGAGALAAASAMAATSPFVVVAATTGGEAHVSDTDNTYTTSSSTLSDYYVLSEVVPAAVGVPGAINVYSARDTITTSTTYHEQSFAVDVGSTGGSFNFSGGVSLVPGSTLVNGGYGSLSIDLSGWAYALNSLNDGTVQASFSVNAATFTYSRKLGVFVDDVGTYVRQYQSYWTNLGTTLPLTFSGRVVTSEASLSGFSFSLNGYLNTAVGTDVTRATTKTLLQSVATPALTVPEPDSVALVLAGLSVVGFVARRRVA